MNLFILAKKFKKKEDEAPAKLLDDLFRKTKATPCIYWLPLSAETVPVVNIIFVNPSLIIKMKTFIL